MSLHGIIPLYKPKGLTSHDCVHRIRKLTKCKKVGHTGTLDPNVEGVLPICIGEATKIIPFLQNLRKTYVADIYLGKATTTEDSYGEVIAEKLVEQLPTDAEIAEVLLRFTGEITQKTPMYSAVKVKGKKLYEYARENIPVEQPMRNVTIYQLDRIQSDRQKKNNPIGIRVVCSKGTYIRTLSVDIGRALGYPAHMSYLLREESDSFTLDETFTFSEIEAATENNELQNLLFPMDRALKHLPTLEVDANMKRRVLQGQKLLLPKVTLTNPFKIMHGTELLAIYELHQQNKDVIKPIRVFNLHKNEGEPK